MKRASSRSKFGVPRPVTGSHPRAVGNPPRPQATFVPLITSLNALANAWV